MFFAHGPGRRDNESRKEVYDQRQSEFRCRETSYVSHPQNNCEHDEQCADSHHIHVEIGCQTAADAENLATVQITVNLLFPAHRLLSPGILLFLSRFGFDFLRLPEDIDDSIGNGLRHNPVLPAFLHQKFSHSLLDALHDLVPALDSGVELLELTKILVYLFRSRCLQCEGIAAYAVFLDLVHFFKVSIVVTISFQAASISCSRALPFSVMT